MLKSMLRKLYKRVLTDDTRSSLASLSLLKLVFWLRNQDSSTRAITDFAVSQVVVLAPHMDDEVLGCGGALRRHALAGARITVVYMTDGSKGNPDIYRHNLSTEAIAKQEAELCRLRKDEAKRAADILGISELIFLDFPDGGLKPTPKLIARVLQLLRERSPAIIYHPSVFDLHPDHWATNCVLAGAARSFERHEEWQPVYRGYEVWTPQVANRVADITEVTAIKQDAVAQFTSQLAHTDFARTILGLNAYRSLYQTQGQGYAEAFYECPPALHRVLLDSVSPGRGER